MNAIEPAFSFVFQNKFVLKDFQIKILCGLHVSKVTQTFSLKYLEIFVSTEIHVVGQTCSF